MKGIMIVAAILAAAMAFGCTHGPYAPRTYKSGTTSMEHTSKVIFTDKGLSKDMRVVDVSSAVQPDGRLKVNAELENSTGKTMVIQVQTQFRGAQGVLSEDVTNWHTIVVAPHSSTSYQTVSMSSQAQDYVIRVKPEVTEQAKQ